MSELAKRKCVPCEEGGEPLNPDQVEVLMQQLSPEWMLIDQHRMLARTFRFKNFQEALDMANKIGKIAEEENHHPDLTVAWGSLGVELMTHAMDGLSENDFIVAAKIDELK
ncbi:4a-hydroxytetrahydrobiopterin dehydratase [Candidatus Kaiserbacteria bacterium]|nr:4a-hydroxytetrahydrobiopterin dehydratase [Candidatus Kaiserbacteria bacterium]